MALYDRRGASIRIIMTKTSITCLLIMTCIIFNYIARYHKHKQYGIKFNQTYFRCLISSIIYISSNLLIIIWAQKPNLNTSAFGIMGLMFRLSAAMFLATICHMCSYVTQMAKIPVLYKKNVRQGCIFVSTISVIVAFFLPLKIKITPQGAIATGVIITFTHTFWALITIAVIAQVVTARSKLGDSEKVNLTMSILANIVAMMIRKQTPSNYDALSVCLTLISLVCFLGIENPDIRKVLLAEEEKQIALEANKAKTLFISNVSHEIRTPMNVVSGMTEILSKTPLSSEQRKYVENIRKSSDSLLLIINDILDFSRIDSGKMEIINNAYDTQTMFEDVRLMMQTKLGSKPISLIFNIDKSVPVQFIGDEIRIKQILINLLNNSIKFTELGKIELRASAHKFKNNIYKLHIEVEDTGQGMHKEDLKKIFKAFGQVDKERNQGKEGTGLGLSICNSLIGMMNGKLSVVSEYEKGTTFEFDIEQTLPESYIEIKKNNTAILEHFIAPDAKLLIVDDNDLNLEVMRGLCKQYQILPETVNSGTKAIYSVNNSEPYDIIFMDRMMPGMSGTETIEKIRELSFDIPYLANVPIIALTADLTKEAHDAMYTSGANDFLNKPVKINELEDMLRKWLPKEKIHVATVEKMQNANNDFVIFGCDFNKGVENCGDRETYLKILESYADSVDENVKKINAFIKEKDYENYTILTHSMKSTSRTIGCAQLGDDYYALELAGQSKNKEFIAKETENVLNKTLKLKDDIYGYLKKAAPTQETLTKTDYKDLLNSIVELAQIEDIEGIDNIGKILKVSNYADKTKKLKEYIKKIDFENVIKECQQLAEEGKN